MNVFAVRIKIELAFVWIFVYDKIFKLVASLGYMLIIIISSKVVCDKSSAPVYNGTAGVLG